MLEAWETFACVSRDELLDLIFVFGHDWVIKSTAKLVRPTEIGFESPFLLRFGDVAFDLRYNLPFMSAERDQDWNDAGGRPEDHIRLFSITLLTDGWRIDGARLFRPLIFYTAFKSPAVHGQVEVSIGSLIEFGRYAGHVHVITDRTKEAVLEALPGLPENALSVQRIDAEDFVGYVSAKYTILDWHDAYSYQPIFFMDADIVFDHDIEEMLLAVALSDRISAPIELGNLLESHPGVGSTLIQAAGHSPRYATGFNAGTIGVPNLRDHGNVLELIRRILVNRLDLFGRLNMIWVDQEIANYVSYRVANFDTHLLSRYTRIAIPDVEHDPRHRTGLVHFWPFGAPEDKLRGMITYLEILRRS